MKMTSQGIPTIDIKKYGGKQVAILDGKIVAVGGTLEGVIRKVRRKAPSRPLSEFLIVAVPKSLTVIYYA